MEVLDSELDISPTATTVRDFAELRARNLLCFEELAYYNSNGCFKRVHPIVINKLEYRDLAMLWLTDRAQFFTKHKNCAHNVYRYSGGRNEALHIKHSARLALFDSIVNGNIIR